MRSKPLIVLPSMHYLPAINWGYGWCKLDEVCELVPSLAKRAGEDFEPTPEELVHKFAALIERNKGILPGPKIFRYSVDGTDFRSTKVPKYVPHSPFELDVGVPYPKGLFVPAPWACDTLLAILQGAVTAWDTGEYVFGARRHGGNMIYPGRYLGFPERKIV